MSASVLSTNSVSRRIGRRGPGKPPSDPTHPCASYSRFSSDLQREDSISDQQRKCCEKAATNGHTIQAEFEFHDEAVSGTKLDRTGLNALLAAAAAGRFKVLYLHSLSRLARESVISLPLLKQLVYNFGVRVISVSEGIDSDNTAWELIAHIMSIVHEQYVRDLAENVLRGQEGTVLSGMCVGDCCFGYASVPIQGSEQSRRGRNAKPRKMYVIDPETAPWVARIFDWFTRERRPLRWIVRELNRLAAPKDHRATKPHWRHQYLPRLLRNRKYLGWWSWGKMANARDPLTGKVRQEERTPEECEKWTRHFPHLQMIDNETFELAQELLAKNSATAAVARGAKGRLKGSCRGSAAEHPRHLLSGLIECGHCGSTMHVGGTHGKYLFCQNHPTGACGCKTQLLRKRAETMVLDAIGRRILANPAWRQTVLHETLKAWNRQESHVPAELAAARKALADVELKIGRLMDRLEDGQGGPELDERLAQRRIEKRKLAEDVKRLEQADSIRKPRPTATWIDERLSHLGEVLSGDKPDAAHALRNLVGGKIVVMEIREPGRQRHYLQGRFAVEISTLVGILLDQESGATTAPPGEAVATEEIVIDFRDVSKAEKESEEAWALYQQGMLMSAIGEQLGRKKSYITKLIRQACATHGVEFVDGRKRRASLIDKNAVPAMYKTLIPEVMQRYAAGQLLCEIAKALDCNKATVKKALDEGYAARGEQTPDGRSRRKGLKQKVSHPRRKLDGTVGRERVA